MLQPGDHRPLKAYRIFITGAADGLGQMAAKLLVADGHQVVLHARNKSRASEALKAVPGAETAAADPHIQDRFLDACREFSGVKLPD